MTYIDLNSKSNWVYDLEVYPNLFSGTFINLITKDKKIFVVHGDRDDRSDLVSFMEQEDLVLVGFNSLGYDNIVLNCLLDNLHAPSWGLTRILYNLSKAIIGSQKGESLPPLVKKYKWQKTSYKSIDLMHIRPSSQTFISLKQIGINLKWYRVQDLPLPFDQDVPPDKVEALLDYNENDVLITCKLFEKVKPQIQLRIDILERYGIDVINRDESAIANAFLNKFYSEYSGNSYDEFRDLRTIRQTIALKDCVPDNLSFNSVILQNLQEELRNTVLNQSFDPVKKRWGFKLKKVLHIGGITFDMGSGGLHSRDKDKPGIFSSDDDSEIWDADVTSFYPFLGKNYRIKPEHLEDCYFDILDMVITERVKAKKSGDKVGANALKIVANSGFFGKFGSEHFWLKDDLALMRVTIAGQLVILSLIDRFVNNGIEVLSANTDGVTCRVKKNQKSLYDRICQTWQAETNFELEFVKYNQYVRRDVNNYFTLKPDGEFKEKGCFERSQNLHKGYKTPAIPIALHEYFVNGVEPSVSLRSLKTIYDFCISQKTAQEFETKFFTLEEGEFKELSLQKNNRFYVSNRGGSIYKTKAYSSRKTSLMSGETVTLANDVDESIPIESYDVDYDFYEREVWKVIDVIQPRIQQLSLIG